MSPHHSSFVSALRRLGRRALLGLGLALGTLVWSTTVHAEPFAYITNFDSNDVSVIDTATNTVVATVPVGSHPVGVAVTPDGAYAYVANAGSNNVSVIETATNTVTATVPVGTSPLAFGQFIGPVICGNGIVGPGEQCDDGNTTNGDGCSSTCTVALRPFSPLATTLSVERGPGVADDEIELRLTFALGAGSNGLAPRTEVVEVALGPLAYTIPAGALRPDSGGSGGRVSFVGRLEGIPVEVRLRPVSGARYEFRFKARGLGLASFPSPAGVRLRIGDDQGTATVPVVFE